MVSKQQPRLASVVSQEHPKKSHRFGVLWTPKKAEPRHVGSSVPRPFQEIPVDLSSYGSSAIDGESTQAKVAPCFLVFLVASF